MKVEKLTDDLVREQLGELQGGSPPTRPLQEFQQDKAGIILSGLDFPAWTLQQADTGVYRYKCTVRGVVLSGCGTQKLSGNNSGIAG